MEMGRLFDEVVKIERKCGLIPGIKMPGMTHRTVNKGKRSALEKMEKIVRVVMKTPSLMNPDTEFAIITKIFGNGAFQVKLQDKSEVAAKIYSKTLRKAKCWTVGAILMVCPGARKGEYEIESLLERADAKRCGLLPDWMLSMADGADADAKDAAFEFEEEEDELLE
jgi:hypothetical protein